MEPNADGERARVGLCARCRFAAVQRSARGGRFWRCRRADSDPAYTRYPPLPVQRCPGFEPGDPHDEPKASEVPKGKRSAQQAEGERSPKRQAERAASRRRAESKDLRRTAAGGYHCAHSRRWR